MLDIDHHILGNGILHQRFCTSVEILARLVSCAPRAITLRQMEESSGCPAAELEPLCADLARAGLLRQPDGQSGGWALACRPADATLEDVFRGVLGSRGEAAPPAASEPHHPEVGLLMMQVTMAINQSVFRHLRQFPLDRLKSRAAAWPAAADRQRAPVRGLRYPEPADYGFARAAH